VDGHPLKHDVYHSNLRDVEAPALTMLAEFEDQALLEQYIRSVMTEEDIQALLKEFLAPSEDVAGGYDPEALLSDDEAEYIATHVEFYHEWA
jgi:hypothetical protein